MYIFLCELLINYNIRILNQPLSQVTATNNAFTSKSSQVLNITFDPANDVDDLVNASMTRLNATAVQLEWHEIRNVDGYVVQMRLPPDYAIREPVITKHNNVTRKLLLAIF